MTSPDFGYLQHSAGATSFNTERVTVRPCSYPHAGQWEAWFEGRWRRVHVQLRRTFIAYRGTRITIQIEGI